MLGVEVDLHDPPLCFFLLADTGVFIEDHGKAVQGVSMCVCVYVCVLVQGIWSRE